MLILIIMPMNFTAQLKDMSHVKKVVKDVLSATKCDLIKQLNLQL